MPHPALPRLRAGLAALLLGAALLTACASVPAPHPAPAAVAPAPAPAAWRDLIGDYAHSAQILIVREADGRLEALTGKDGAPVALDGAGAAYRSRDGRAFAFTRDADGRAQAVRVQGVEYRRVAHDTPDGGSFRIEPLHPVEELRDAALAATPPLEKGSFRAAELVELAPLDPAIRLDIRYASTNNFLGVPLYTQARAFLQRPAAQALLRAQRELAREGYGLLIHDGYRPWYVTKMFWDATPDAQKEFVADPSKGSRHNRGCAVDLTLYELASGAPIEMTGGYDEMTARSYPDYPGGTTRQRWHRDLLRRAMEAQGFTVYPTEWWHFDYVDWPQYAIGTAAFEEL
ncbi:MAG: M15 family metallopeptidase [Rhodanobacteraceae bacterium]|nr:M15 family metallopeptidase [Rhodanobacteraceae bacterium]